MTNGGNQQRKIPATLISGDGIGPEIVDAGSAVLDAMGAPFAWDMQLGGWPRRERPGSAAPGNPRQHPPDPAGPQGSADDADRRRLPLVNVRLREEFQLYANLRPVRTLVPGGRYENIDLVLVRENLEGLYVGFEHYIPIGDDPHAVAIATGVNTRTASRGSSLRLRIRDRTRRKKVTIVHKANVLKALTGIFLEAGQQIAKEYEGRSR